MNHLADDQIDIDVKTLDADASEAVPAPRLEVPPRLPLRSITLMPSLFQPRLAADDKSGVAFGEFVSSLLKDLRRADGGLDPLKVWWSGKRWVLIDGHHRFAAYGQDEKWKCRPIPVSVVGGDRSAACAASIEENSKRHLSMTATDRTNSAWKLVCLSGLSKRETALTAKVSESTVRDQRRRKDEILAALPDQYTAESLSQLPWREVNSPGFLGETLTPERDPTWIERLAADWHERLGSTFGAQLVKNPEAFAMAIRMHSEALPQMLMESAEWSDVRDELAPDWAAESVDVNDDF